MRSVTYQSIQDAFSSSLVGTDALLDAEKTAFRRSFVNAYRDAWYGALWDFAITTAEITPDTFGQVDLTAISDYDQALSVYRYDPNKSSDVTQYAFRLESDKLTLNDKRTTGSSEGTADSATTKFSLKYRKREPVFQGSDYSATSTYSSGDVVYFTEAGQTGYEGDWYKASASTSAGESPYNTSASWTKQSVAHELSQHVLHRCYADWLMADSQHSKAAIALNMADNYLFISLDRLERQSGQTNNTSVVGYTSALSNGHAYA
jgi:hypothetical protein